MSIVLAPASKRQEQFLNSDATITLAGGAAGSGKALRHGEKVLLTSGFKNIEDVVIGDLVVTPNNTVEKVTAIYPQGKVQLYKLTFQDGSTVEACGEHLWKWRKSGEKKYIISNTLDVKNWMDQQKPGKDNCKRKPMVDLVEPLDFGNKVTLPIAPYTLGALLGDGSMTTRSVSIISQDDEIIKRIQSEGYLLTQWQLNDKRTAAKTYGVSKCQQALRELELLGCNSSTKFIPEVYLTASVEDRFALLQGLMDTDGYVDKHGSTEFCTISLGLKNGISFLLRSLGFTVTCSTKLPSYRNSEGVKVQGQLAYVLYIRGKNQQKLFSIERKVKRTKYKNVSNAIVKIEATEKDFATCISISGEEKMFVTSNFIPTHNTFTALMIALKFMQHPKATGVIFRRTSKMITSPGSIWHEAVAMYQSIYPKGLKIRNRENEIVFPNGALLKFSHMQHESNMYDHKGGQYSFVAFDEATDFSFAMVTYMLSRMRNAYVDYTPQMFLMTNPSYDSFLREWIQDFYLDQNTGIPLPEQAGKKRWFVMQGNTMLWYDSVEEAEAVHGKSEESGVTSFVFYPATCLDNPPLLKANPSYISRLKSLPRVEMERLLLGSWFARSEASGIYKRDWTPLVDHPNWEADRKVRCWDLAFSKPSEQYPNPDWTRGVLMSKDNKSKLYTVEDLASIRDRVHEVEKLIFNTAQNDGRSVIIGIPKDPNAAAGAYALDLQRRLSEMGFTCRLMKPVQSKVVRFAPFSSLCQAGYVRVVSGDWNKEFFDELEVFDGSIKQKNDIVDAVSDCFSILNKEIVLPSFSLPDFTGSSRVSSISTGMRLPITNASLPI